MTRLRDLSHVVLMLTLAVVIAALGHKSYQTLQHADELVIESRQRVKDTSQNANAVLIQLGLMADEARQASITTKQAAEQQKQLFAATSENIRHSTEDMDTLIRHTDTSLNGDLLPQLAATIAQANLELKREGDDMHATLVAAQLPINTANARLGDPNIPKTLGNIQELTASANKTAQDVNKAVHDSTHPTKTGQTVSGVTTLMRILSWFLK